MKYARVFIFAIWAVLMTALTYVLGAPALKALRRRMGRGPYWICGTVVCAGLVVGGATLFGISLASLVVLMGVFEELDEMDFGLQSSAFFALLLNSLIAGGAFALWVFHSGSRWSQLLLAFVEERLKPVLEINPRLQFDYSELILQLPSVAIIVWMISLYLAALLEPRLDNSSSPEVVGRLRAQLREFRLPDACVWIFIVALLGSFAEIHVRSLEVLSINALNVCVLLFFFQGIAVVGQFFENMRLGAIWQTLLMIVLVVQLFIFVSVLGLLDHWVDFRLRMAKRSEEFKKEV